MKKKIRTALISVSDKNNLKPLLNILKKNKIKIISSGGTYKEIRRLKFNCLEVSNFTNSSEILEGRVNTLHPKIHAGILNKRERKSHLKDLKDNGFENIDLVIVNFYPFENTLKKTNNHQKIIENIDVGGPTMVRSAAKNYNDVTVITSSDQYYSHIIIVFSCRPNHCGTAHIDIFYNFFMVFCFFKSVLKWIKINNY